MVFFRNGVFSCIVLLFCYSHAESSFLEGTFISSPGLKKIGKQFSHKKSVSLQAVSKQKLSLIDGPELSSLQSFLFQEGTIDENPLKQIFRGNNDRKVGFMNIATGTIKDDGRQVVGIVAPPGIDCDEGDFVCLDDKTFLFSDSIADIPTGVSEDDAMATLSASLAGVHCAIPRLQKVGGGDDSDGQVFGKVVIVGGSDYAAFLADAIASIGAEVSFVTTGKSRPKNKLINSIGPSSGELEVGFSDYVGTFQSLVDTIGDENGSDFGEDSTTIQKLKTYHQCERYISTVTQSQKIVTEDGILFGPKKAESYLSETSTSVLKQRNSKQGYSYVVPPQNFGKDTLQILLNSKVLFKSGQNNFKGTVVRGWSLKDFWESASWPRDSAGAGDTRFGFPVLDDIESIDVSTDKMVSAPPKLAGQFAPDIPDDPYEKGSNPFVLEIEGISQLNQHILEPKKDCMLFLSAPFCRTCKKLSPQFTTFARKNQEDNSDEIIFAKAHASGPIGKDIGKSLNVDAVPTFVMFRKGEVYGDKLSVTRIPSRELDVAVKYLASGSKWNKEEFTNMVTKDE